MDSILTSIKKMLGFDESYTAFDTDIIIFINSALMVLNQLGVGPTIPYRITSKTETWASFFGGKQRLESVQEFVYLSVRVVFDPPASSSVLEAYKSKIRELTFRLNAHVDPEDTFVEATL